MTFIWATRGRSWGFRFLRDGGFPDPLPEYDKAFSGIEGEREAWRRIGATVAVRFPDPLGRQDAAGRVIPHDFVVFAPLAARINSVQDGKREIWHLVEEDFERVWKLPQAPPTSR